MALNKEDKKDVAGAMGKALANKVSKVTRDSGYSSKTIDISHIINKKRKTPRYINPAAGDSPANNYGRSTR
jgi:hypothetical protein